MFLNQKGFTLLEILVVVLIIGILAAIALPKYQRAVAKTRYAELKNLTNSIYYAQKRYYLANGTYADTFDKLDITIKNGSTTNKVYFRGSYEYCTISLSDSYQFCINEKVHLSYIVYFSGTRRCRAYENNQIAHFVCQEETGKKNTNDYPYPDKI